LFGRRAPVRQTRRRERLHLEKPQLQSAGQPALACRSASNTRSGQPPHRSTRHPVPDLRESPSTVQSRPPAESSVLSAVRRPPDRPSSCVAAPAPATGSPESPAKFRACCSGVAALRHTTKWSERSYAVRGIRLGVFPPRPGADLLWQRRGL